MVAGPASAAVAPPLTELEELIRLHTPYVWTMEHMDYGDYGHMCGLCLY